MKDLSDVVKKLELGQFEVLKEVFKKTLIPHVASHVRQQRQRLGGDWAVAFALTSREEREQAKELLGEDVVFIVLNLSDECQVSFGNVSMHCLHGM